MPNRDRATTSSRTDPKKITLCKGWNWNLNSFLNQISLLFFSIGESNHARRMQLFPEFETTFNSCALTWIRKMNLHMDSYGPICPP